MESDNLSATRHIRRVRSLNSGGSSTPPETAWENARCPCYVFTLVNLCVLMAIVYVHNAGGGSLLPQFDLLPVFPENSVANNSAFPLGQSAAADTGGNSLPQASTDQKVQEYESMPAAAAILAGATGNTPTVINSTKSVLNAADDSRAKLTAAIDEHLPKDVNSTQGSVQSATLKPILSLSWSASLTTAPSISAIASVSAAQTWTSSMPSIDSSSSSSHSASFASTSSSTNSPAETATHHRTSSTSSYGTSSVDFHPASAAAVGSLTDSTNASAFANNTTGAGHPPRFKPAPSYIGGQSSQGLTTNVSSAVAESTTKRNISTLPCPTLFVYPNVPVFDGGAKLRDITFKIAFGEKLSYPGIYMHSQFNLAELVMYRLHHSKHCRVTTNASDADLFIIPVLTAPKGAKEWGQACADSKLWRKHVIGSEAGNTLSFLPHLNNQTASKHVFIVSKGHYYGMSSQCDWIPGEPPFSPVFRNIQRFAYSHTYIGHRYNARKWDGGNAPLRLDGRVISVPYPSSFHWSAAEFGRKRLPPWQQFDDRPTRVFLVARVHGKQRDLRQRLANDCKAAGKPLCKGLTTFDESAMEDKQRAVFCLEPEGDSPFRKSVYDSIVSGCIPVLFSPDSDAVSPWHWGLFRESSRVLLSESEYMAARPGVDGLRVLYDMPQKQIAELQASIARYAHRLQISIDDYPSGDDLFEVMLKKAHLRSQGHALEELATSW